VEDFYSEMNFALRFAGGCFPPRLGGERNHVKTNDYASRKRPHYALDFRKKFLLFRDELCLFDRVVENKTSGRNPHHERRAQEKEQRRQLILETAFRLFAQNGYRNTTMAEIAAAARLGKATLYYYFPSKEAIYTAMHGEMVDRYYRRLLETLWQTPRERLFSTMMHSYLDFMEQNPHFLRLFMPLGTHAPEELLNCREIAELRELHHQELNRLFAARLPRMAPEDANLMIQIIWTFLLGLSSKLLRGYSRTYLDKEIDHLETIFNAFFKEKT